MPRTLFSRVAGAIVVPGALFACGGKTIVEPDPNRVTVTPSVPATVPQLAGSDFPAAELTISASVSSSKGLPTAKTCTLDGASFPCDRPMKIMPGTYTWCVTGTSGGAAPVQQCGQVSVALRIDQKRLIGFDADRNEHPCVGCWYVLGPSGQRDSAQAGPDGVATLNSRWVGMLNAPADFRGDAVLKPSFGRTGPEYWATRAVAMGSRQLNTPVCATTGPTERVIIDLNREGFTLPPPYLDGGENIPLFIRTKGANTWYYQDGSWPEFPVKVAFDSTISPADSVRFWAQADSLNRAFCQERIRPANRSEAKTNGILVFLQRAFAASAGGIARDYRYGSVIVDTTVFHDAKGVLLWHEFGHAVGAVGHECEYVSIMFSSCYPPFLGVQKKDVAYMLWKERLVALERTYDTRIGLAWAHQGERRERELLEESVVWLTKDGSAGFISQPTGAISLPSPAFALSSVREPPMNLFPALIVDHWPDR